MSMKSISIAAASFALLVTVAGLALSNAPQQVEPPKPGIHVVHPGPDAEHEIQGLLIGAVPGDVIQLEAGTFEFQQEIINAQDNVTIRGRGHDKTILSFKKQNAGSKGVEATGDAFVMEDLAVEDTIGNAIKVLGANGVTFRGVRTEWTGGPKETNGAYGLYPVQCKNVLVEGCIAIGASDAGIYVGQSEDVVVRNSRAEYNVAGIEIENCINADVYDCVATNNTGGILVFDLPGLALANGQNVRIYNNKMYENNHPNFAPPGNIVGNVPPGSGLTVMAMVDVEVFGNEIRDNNTFNVSVYSYLMADRPIKDKNYSPYAERVYIHDNIITGGGKKPGGPRAKMLVGLLGKTLPQVFYDGAGNPKSMVDGKLPKEEGLLLWNNGDGVDIANINLISLNAGKVNVDRDIANYTGQGKRVPATKLAEHPQPNPEGAQTVAIYRAAPLKLSEYGLFEGDGSTQKPAEGTIPYDLNTELFADYMTKRRFVRVPQGASAKYDAHAELDFPVGTVIAKTFSAPRDMQDLSKGEELLETRIIKHEPSGWYGFAYVWNEEQTEATLSLGGGHSDVSWVHGDGQRRQNNYIIPNANQCKSCHVIGDKFRPIGPKARNLNKEYDYGHGVENQLAYWSRAGALKGAPSPKDAPQVARSDDPSSGTIHDRARAWLDVNCAHCHSPEGPARTSGLDLSYAQQDPTKYGVWKAPVAAGRGSGKRKYSIVPGKPDESILVYRLDSTEPGVMMPELPRRMIHTEGVALIREWIEQMQDTESKAGAGAE